MAAKRKTTKKDLEAKIAELEAQLSKLEATVEKPSEAAKEKPKTSTKPEPTKAEPTKPKGTLPKGFEAKAEPPKPKPEPTKAEPTKPKGTLPKGFEAKAEPPKPKPEPTKAEPTKPKGTLPKGFEAKAEPPKPTPKEDTAQPPVTYQAALEDAYYNSPQTDFHQYRAKVTGYSPAPNRYFVRRTAPVGKVPTTNWNEQKATVTGYTQPSNQYFATRPRLAYHPPDKTFGGFSGVAMTVEGVAQHAPPPQTESPKPDVKSDTNAPPPQTSTKSRSEQLAEYEKGYLERLEEQTITESAPEETQPEPSIRGTLPKGFEPKPKPESPKKSRGTLPKGF